MLFGSAYTVARYGKALLLVALSNTTTGATAAIGVTDQLYVERQVDSNSEHDGRQIAFVAIMYPQAADDAANKALLAEHRARKSSARIYEGFPIRNWDRWLDERQVRIFVQKLDDEGLALGEPRDLLAGIRLLADPGFSGRQTDTGEELEMEFTPDSRALVFGASTNLDEAARSFTDAQLFVVDITGGEPRQITRGSNIWSKPRFLE